MLCVKCGEKNEDNAKFCVKCGEKLNNSQMEKNESMPKVNLFGAANDKNRKVRIAAVAIAIIVELGIIVFLLSGRSYEETANLFVDAVFNADVKTIIKLIPEDVEEEEYDKIVEEIEENLQSQVVDAIESNVGEDWKVTHRVMSVEDLSLEKFKALREHYKDFYDIRISGAKIVKMELKINAKDYDNSENAYIHLIKVGQSWYVDSLHTSFHLKSTIGRNLYFYF